MPDPASMPSSELRPRGAAEAAAGDPAPERTAAERVADHRAVERLATELLPVLIGRLTAGGLAEIEVREGDWKVRLRRPLEAVGTGRRVTDRQFRLPVQAGQAHAPLSHPAPTRDGARQSAPRPADPGGTPPATSPAGGIFRPLPGIAGRRVHAGDRLGAVDVLGMPQEVVAPADGIVGPLIAEAGDGVEYGQPVMEMRPLPAPDEPSDGEAA